MNSIRFAIENINFIFFEKREYVHLISVNKDLYARLKEHFLMLLNKLSLYTEFTNTQFDFFCWLLKREYKYGISQETLISKYLGENSIIANPITESGNIFKEHIPQKYRIVCDMILPFVKYAYDDNHDKKWSIRDDIRMIKIIKCDDLGININFAISMILFHDIGKIYCCTPIRIEIITNTMAVILPCGTKYEQDTKSFYITGSHFRAKTQAQKKLKLI